MGRLVDAWLQVTGVVMIVGGTILAGDELGRSFAAWIKRRRERRDQ